MNDDLSSKAIEQKVLSYLLEYSEEQVEHFPRLNSFDFYHFGDTYELFNKLFESDNEALDSPTAYNRGNESQMNDILRTSVTPGEIDTLIDNLKDLSYRRKLLGFTKEIEGAIQSEDSIRDQVIELEDKFVNLTTDFYSDKTIVPISSLIDEVKDHLDNLREQDHISGIDTGLFDLNSILSGYQPGEYTLIAARTSIGKTDLMLNSALQAAKNGHKTAIFSLEMTSTNLIKRLTAQVSKVDRQDIRRGLYNDNQEKKIKGALKKLAGLPLSIDDSSRRIDTINYLIQRQVKREKMDIAFIDYFGLIDAPSTGSWSVQDQKANLSHRLKFLAKETGIPVVVLAQLNRSAEGSGEPKISHLRGTGALEQDADTTLILTRPKLKNKANIKVGKQRNGPTGDVDVRYVKDTGRFEDEAVE